MKVVHNIFIFDVAFDLLQYQTKILQLVDSGIVTRIVRFGPDTEIKNPKECYSLSK
jgi:hypothetical protein